jgi:hypothetical protein
MRYYLPLGEKKAVEKSRVPSTFLPLWAWLLLIALMMLVVVVLR